MTPTENSTSAYTKSKESIVVIHGIGSKRFLMYPMCQRLRRLGYRVINWGYPSYYGGIEGHAKRFRELLQKAAESSSRIHIVAHSLGAIVARAALSHDFAVGRDSPIGRIVLLAPPNHGSAYARYFGPALGWFCKSVSDLSDRPNSFVNSLPNLSAFEVGILAARYDFLVTEPSTHLPNETDHLMVDTFHSSMLFSKEVVELTGRFLESGRFRA